MVGEAGQPIKSVGEELNKWRSLRAQLEAVDDIDEQCVLDTLEGETNLNEALLEIEKEVAERETMAEALGLRIKDLQSRKARFENAADTLRI